MKMKRNILRKNYLVLIIFNIELKRYTKYKILVLDNTIRFKNQSLS